MAEKEKQLQAELAEREKQFQAELEEKEKRFQAELEEKEKRLQAEMDDKERERQHQLELRRMEIEVEIRRIEKGSGPTPSTSSGSPVTEPPSHVSQLNSGAMSFLWTPLMNRLTTSKDFYHASRQWLSAVGLKRVDGRRSWRRP